MGIADIIPGVSGGTIAFITGIYDTLLTAITAFNVNTLGELCKGDLSKVWQKIKGGFLLTLLSGIFCSVLFFSKIIGYLLTNHRIGIWSFFFGLVSGSVWLLFKSIKKWTAANIAIGFLAIFIAYYITTIPAFSNDEPSLLFLFFSGALAACALILPGISGAFILVLLGSYGTILKAIETKNLLVISIVGLGAIVGLMIFSKLLKHLFKHHKNNTVTALIGFIIGSLNKIWPWKKVLSWRENSKGIQVPFLEKSVFPQNYEGDPKIFLSVIFILTGFLTIIFLSYFSSKKIIPHKKCSTTASQNFLK